MIEYSPVIRSIRYLLFVCSIALIALSSIACSSDEPEYELTVAADNIIPTSTPSDLPAVDPTPINTPISTLIPLDESEKAIINTADFERFGVSGSYEGAQLAYKAGIRFRHLFTWGYQADTTFDDDVTLWQMLRVGDRSEKYPAAYPWDWDAIMEVIEENPGAYWMIGNEPDVIWQDNVTPEVYAERYHEAYTTIKEADPDAQIVAGSITQGTPIRLQWLDMVLDSYQEMYGEKLPAEAWSLHAYTLREQRGTDENPGWGVDIPPGIDVDEGVLYEIDDHGKIELFEQNILAFRRWMADNEYDVPLAVSEFGILLPFDYGFPPDFVEDYMIESLEILRTLTDESGYSKDDNHVAQVWFWFIIEDSSPDPLTDYSTGNLYDSAIGEPTFLGEAWIDYLAKKPGE